MSLKQNRKRLGRMCEVCGEAAGRKTVCGRCSPRRGCRAHRDKYATTPDNVDLVASAIDTKHRRS